MFTTHPYHSAASRCPVVRRRSCCPRPAASTFFAGVLFRCPTSPGSDPCWCFSPEYSRQPCRRCCSTYSAFQLTDNFTVTRSKMYCINSAQNISSDLLFEVSSTVFMCVVSRSALTLTQHLRLRPPIVHFTSLNDRCLSLK